MKNFIFVSLLSVSVLNAWSHDDKEKHNKTAKKVAQSHARVVYVDTESFNETKLMNGLFLFAGYDKKDREKTYSTPYTVCDDGSCSYSQPTTPFKQGGLCGPVAISNLLQMYCKSELSPVDIDLEYNNAEGWNSGTNETEMKYAINYAFQENCGEEVNSKYHWKYSHSANAVEYIERLYRALNWTEKSPFQITYNGKKYNKWPVAAAIDHELTGGHFVTVVDIDTTMKLTDLDERKSIRENLKGASCDVIFNTWGKQYRLDCSTFAYWAKYPNRNNGDKYEIHELSKGENTIANILWGN